MKGLPHYDRVECDYDLDHEITRIVEETKKSLEEIEQLTQSKADYRCIAKAMIQTILDTI